MYATFINSCFSRQKSPYLHYKILPNHRFSSIQRSHLQSISHTSILQEVKEIKPLRQVHANIVTSGLSQNIFLSNRLLNSYASYGSMDDAQKFFHQMPCKNVVSWTILISGYAKNDRLVEAVDVFRKMTRSVFMPNAVTISSILPVFGKLGLIQIGKSVHSLWIRRDCGRNVFLETSLVILIMGLVKKGWGFSI